MSQILWISADITAHESLKQALVHSFSSLETAVNLHMLASTVVADLRGGQQNSHIASTSF